ncbi:MULTISPECIES: hypothetical protein [Paenibacillus]|nr:MULTISPECIES: hypothetical protein [Paenibacillus]MEC0228742.1 hypothetical protein [Paenibacillus alba]NQX67511.1 hypothetical protein [Paenibacillus alba]UKS24469.1 hypothetical protein LOZ80_22930 [Paenibacillus sp. HWE-109]GGI44029.1 hypothetical protein GCM10008018_05060 [Paenibacillus marchantiophytorum]
MRMNILFNKKPISVNFIGTDHKLIPSLINALRYNKFTTMNLVHSVERVDLFSSEAILYAKDGNKARIPIF